MADVATLSTDLLIAQVKDLRAILQQIEAAATHPYAKEVTTSARQGVDALIHALEGGYR